MVERCILVFICFVASNIALWLRVKLREWQCAAVSLFKLVATVLRVGEISIAMSGDIFAAYYRGAMGILLVYDVMDESSFNSTH